MNLATIETKVKSFLKSAEHDVAVVLIGAAKVAPEVAEAAEVGADAAGDPALAAAFQKVSNIVVASGAIVQQASNGTGTGADKLAVAAPQIDTLIKTSGFLGTAAVANVSQWDAAIKTITGAWADMLDSLESKPTPVVSAPPVPAVSLPVTQ